MRSRKTLYARITGAAACAALAGGLIQGTSAAAAPEPKPSPSKSAAPHQPTPGLDDPDHKLGKGWKTSEDRAVTAAADTDGLRILTADSDEAYRWKTVAKLAEPTVQADTWIGNQCFMDADHVAAVYAPRAFTNKPDLMQGGAFAAIVNVSTGKVVKLPFTASLYYFDPSCNTVTRTAAFTAYRDMNDPAKTRTRVVSVDTAGKTVGSAVGRGEITSAVPVAHGAIGGLGHNLVHLDRAGKIKKLMRRR